jgi:hypothetical protein
MQLVGQMWNAPYSHSLAGLWDSSHKSKAAVVQDAKSLQFYGLALVSPLKR